MNLKPHYTHEDPQILHVGTCPDRSYYIPFADEKEAENGLSSRVVSINGAWSFQYFPSCQDILDLEDGLAFDEEEMGQIPVPSCWQNHAMAATCTPTCATPSRWTRPMCPTRTPAAVRAPLRAGGEGPGGPVVFEF